MNHHIRKRRDTFIRLNAFSLEFPEDFPDESPQKEQISEISVVLGEIEQFAGEQTSGTGETRFTYNSKSVSRDTLRDQMDDISTIAGTLAYSIEGIDLLFKIPNGVPDADLLALADAFGERVEPYSAQFIRYGLKTTFINDLKTAKQAFEDSLTPPEMASESRVEATGRLDQAVRRGMIARKILRGIMKVKYKTNPSRMRAWESASHIERDNKTDDDDGGETPKP